MVSINGNEISADCVNTELKEKLIEKLEQSNGNIIVSFENTKCLSVKDIETLEKIHRIRLRICIKGGFDDNRLRDYPAAAKPHKEHSIYKLDEVKEILEVIEQIDANIKDYETQEQKLFYLICYLRRKMVYPHNPEHIDSKEIRSLRGLYNNKPVCAGFAIILKDLCDRYDIECEYVEGSCCKEDHEKGYLTHAWNIVTLKYKIGDREETKKVPIDLTWSAIQSEKGHIFDIRDIGNVNEFIKNHIPGKYEVTQEYEKTLSSLDGKYVRYMFELIYKNFKETAKDTCNEKEERFIIAQVEESIVGDTPLYKYFYQEVKKDKSLGEPRIFYSKFNCDGTCSNYAELTKELEEHKSGSFDKRRIESQKEELFRNSLLSKDNIGKAIERKDYYLGDIKVIPNALALSGNVIRDVLDEDFGANYCHKEQASFIRDDGSSFVLEECGEKTFDSFKVNCYKLYEIEKHEFNKYDVIENTIYTDHDILAFDSNYIANVFLSRERINKHLLETEGYLGGLLNNGTPTYNSEVEENIRKEILSKCELTESTFRPYYPDLTLEDIKMLIKTYELKEINKETIIITKATGEQVNDKYLENQVFFAYLLHCATKGRTISDHFYAIINNSISNSIFYFGTINPSFVIFSIIESCEPDQREITKNILSVLFKNENIINHLKKYYYMQNPSIIDEKETSPTSEEIEIKPYKR